MGETLGANFDRAVTRWPDREALVEFATGRRWTYSSFHDAVEDVAAGMLALGVEKGDRVGIWSPNCGEWVVTQYAAARIGAILVNVNPAYRAHELRFVLEQSSMKLLVSAVRFRQSDYKSMLREVDFRAAVFIGEESWDLLIEKGRSIDRVELARRSATLSFDDPINIQYTSGTTGTPKGATLSHHNILNNGYFVAQGLGYTEADRVCLPVPLYHCFGMVMGVIAAFSHGACVILPGEAFEPSTTLGAVQSEKCTSLYGVPTMYIAELEHPEFTGFDLSSLRTGIIAGSPCPVEVMKRLLSDMNMSGVAICYGMTETSPVSTMTAHDDSLVARTTTVGRVMPHLEVKIVDPASGGVLGRGEPGELCTRGYSVMLGYWNEADKTADVIDAARWMHTGDLAIMHDSGHVDVVGRIKDMVIRGGENIYPREVEEFLHSHPDIADVQVVGVPDEKYGEELMAWVVLRSGAAILTESDIQEFCRDRIAHFKIPRYVEIVSAFPLTVTGKVRKVDLRNQAGQIVHRARESSEIASQPTQDLARPVSGATQ